MQEAADGTTQTLTPSQRSPPTWNVVLLAQGDCCLVHDGQALGLDVAEGEGAVQLGPGVLHRVAVVHAVHLMERERRLQENIEG